MSFKRFLASGLLSVAVLFILTASAASAATLNVSGGQLLGASDVIVAGDLYNVEFLDGTCIDLYSGCDDVSDFTFQTEAAALLASQALMDQVFVDGAFSFDTSPSLTFGCPAALCLAFTPYSVGFVAGARNAALELADGVFTTTPAPIFDTSTDGGIASVVYAVWTVVPEPGTAVLMGLGLLGLSVRNRREV